MHNQYNKIDLLNFTVFKENERSKESAGSLIKLVSLVVVACCYYKLSFYERALVEYYLASLDTLPSLYSL